MATTPRGLPLADGNTVVNPIQTPLNALANATDAALDDLANSITTVNIGYFIGTAAERAALAAPQLRNGITWFETDTNVVWERRSGSWAPRMPIAMATGRLAPLSIGAGAVRTSSVTFPSGRFSRPPVITITQAGTDIRDVTVGAKDVTATGMTVWRGSMSTVSRTVGIDWVAMQMTPTSATG